jgi:UDP-N-acetylmuramoyl-L-alanyl-D-glutamate--2,6-diaminopimelate ligase
VTLGLPGTFNIANAVLATAMLAEAGLDPGTFLPALASARLPGRMERVSDVGADLAAIVDYAHTPDAIAIVLSAVRSWTKGRVIAVFGCGGDRDHAKRPLMGEAAARHADLAVLTDDNPRSEDPKAIRAAALRGARSVPAPPRGEIVEIGDRRQAIEWAIGAARPGDTVLILGKGHEQGQDVGGVVHPFDDRRVVQEVLRQMSDTSGTASADAWKKGAQR